MPAPSVSGEPVRGSIEEPRVLATVRQALLVILFLGLGGTFAELLLLEHVDDFWQLVPVCLLAAGLIIVCAHVARRDSAAVLRVMQATMVLIAASGLAGVLLHYLGNVEFELEMDTALTGFALFREAMMGATPALAPGAMIQLGLLGLAYTFRHPVLARRSNGAASNSL